MKNNKKEELPMDDLRVKSDKITIRICAENSLREFKGLDNLDAAVLLAEKGFSRSEIGEVMHHLDMETDEIEELLGELE